MSTVSDRVLAGENPVALPATSSEIHRHVWQLAWPSVLTFALMTTNSILDRAFVGTLGSNALAASAIGGQLMFLLVSLMMGITVGTTALVSRFTGAKEPDQAARATGQSLGLGLAIGIVCTAAAYAGMTPFLRLVNINGEAERQCRAFLHMALIGTVPMVLGGVLNAAFRGIGDMRTPLRAMIVAICVHLTIAYTLMLGHFGAPKLGLPGGGIGMSVSQLASLIVYLLMLRRSTLNECMSPHNLLLTVEWARRVLRIGVPASVAALLRTTSMIGFSGILTRTADQTAAVAAMLIGVTAESIAFMPGLGFSVAASALVGQSLGARDPHRAEKVGWSASWQAVAIMSTMGAVFFLAAVPFSRVFTHDPTVLRLSVSYLRIMAISEPMLAFGMVLTGALQGAGDTIRPTVLTGLSFWGVRIPLAWFLALHLHMQATGAWIAMSATTIVGGILTIVLWRDGQWKRMKV